MGLIKNRHSALKYVFGVVSNESFIPNQRIYILYVARIPVYGTVVNQTSFLNWKSLEQERGLNYC